MQPQSPRFTRLTFLLIFLAMPISKVVAQVDYFVVDTLYYSGFTLVDHGKRINSNFCHVQRRGVEERLGPLEVSEYGFEDGRVFISRELTFEGEAKSYFLECLVQGEISLYYLNALAYTGFLIESNNELVLLPKYDKSGESFNEAIKVYESDCFDTDLVADMVRYMRGSLSDYFSRLELCIDRAFPRIRYGFGAGYEQLNWEMNYGAVLHMVGNVPVSFGSPTIKAFCELPIVKEYVSFIPEIALSSARFSYSSVVFDEGIYSDVNYAGKSKTLNIPLLFKASTSNNGVRGYVKMGYLTSINFSNSNTLVITQNNSGEISLDHYSHENFIPAVSHGFSVGGGLEIDLYQKSSLFLELRYNSLYYQGDWYRLNNTSFSLQTGILF